MTIDRQSWTPQESLVAEVKGNWKGFKIILKNCHFLINPFLTILKLFCMFSV